MLKSTVKKLNIGFEIGDLITVDNNELYGSYTQFVNRHRKYAARFQYKTLSLDNDAKRLTVVGVYKHVFGSAGRDLYDRNKYVVVVQDQYKRIYLVGETGVRRIKGSESNA